MPLRIHAPLISLSKAEIIRRGTALGVDFSQTVSCYQADAAGPGLRPLRFLPAAARGLRRRRGGRSHPLPVIGRGQSGIIRAPLPGGPLAQW